MAWVKASSGDDFGWLNQATGQFVASGWDSPPPDATAPLGPKLSLADIVGDGMARDPSTGQLRQVYARYDGPGSDYYDLSFEQAPGRNSLAGWAPGYYTDNGTTGLGSFLEPLVIGGLGAIAAAPVAAAAGGGVLGGVAGGAAGGGLSGGIASEFDPQSMLQGAAIGGTLGGALNALLPAAPEVANSGVDFGGPGVGWSPETITGATPTIAPEPVAQSFPVSQPTPLRDLLAQSPTITSDVTAPTIGAVPEPYVPTLAEAGFTQTYTPADPFLVNPSTAETPWLSNAPAGSVFSAEAATPTITALTTPAPAPQTLASTLSAASGASSGTQLPDAGMDLGAFTDPNPYTSGVTQSQINSAAAQGAAANVAAGAGGIAPVATTALTAAGAGIGATKLSDILNGNVGLGDLASQFTLGNLGNLLGTAASVYGANEQANKLKAMYDQYLSLGAPSRQRYEASFQPGFDITGDPVFKSAMDASTDALLRRGSVGGNPYGNPGVLAEIQKYTTSNVALPYLQNYRNQNAATGGYNAFNTAAPVTGGAAVQAGGEVYTDIGRGIGRIMNPQPTLQDFFNQSRMGSLT